MKRDTLEPGIVSILRLFTALWLAQTLFIAARQWLRPGSSPGSDSRLLALSIANMVLLLVYLFWPWLRHWLGRAYLPIALVMVSVGPIIAAHLAPARHRFSTAAVPANATMEVLPILFVPLVIIAWQYNFRSVVLFSLGTVLLDLLLSLSPVSLSDPEFFYYFAPPLVLRTISFLVVGYMVARIMATQRQQRRSLAEANAKLMHYAATLEQLATSRERNRLARELHDTLAHTLSAVAVQLEAVSALWETDPAQARGKLARSLEATRTGLTETRRALQALRATPLEDLGLALAIRQLADSVAERSRLTVDVQVPAHVNDLPPDVEQCVYRVAQESLENATQHAQARHASVRLDVAEEPEARRLTLTVSDDGAGFDPATVDNGYHLGLTGMRERAEVVGGILEVESRPGQGTMVRLIIEEKRT